MVFLQNLSSLASFDNLYPIVEKYGRIIDLHIYPHPDTGELEGFVEFESADPVRKFVLDGEFELAGQKVKPQRCRPEELRWSFGDTESKNTVYVSNLHLDCNKIVLRNIFAEV